MRMRIIRKFLWKPFICVGLAVLVVSLAPPPPPLAALEMVIGEKRVAPGIIYIFEGAVKDDVSPKALHLPENQTHIHIEARVNWDKQNIPQGAPSGGFIPYLKIVAQITHEKTNRTFWVDLLPHINLVDNFHYARNTTLPGGIGDLYNVRFVVLPPTQRDLALHKDWVDKYGYAFTKQQTFTYRKVNFEEIARARRR